MKFTIAALVILASSVSAISPIQANHRFLQSARRLEEGQQQEEEYAFLQNYKIKMLHCKTGEKYVNPENGNYEYSSVVFRLCPTTEECSNDSSTGCKSGYGDYVVGLNTFVENYLEAKRDEMEANAGDDQNFDIEYDECREIKIDQDANNGNGNEEEEQMYYVGPACSDDGKDVKMGFFSEETCTTAPEGVTFEEISNGVSLPYSTGGLVSNYCESCYVANDNGEYELSEMCQRLYESSGKCETNMETFHYSGKNEASCEFIAAMLPKSQKSGNAGKAFGWIFFVLVVGGVGFAAFTFLKKKRAASTEDSKNFGLMNA
jgi:hypothetical protein